MKLLWLSLILLAISITSCTPLKVVSDYQKPLNIGKYETFRIELNKSIFPENANPINGERLQESIKSKMVEMGFKESVDADLLIRFFVNKETKESVMHTGKDEDSLDYKYQYEIYQYKEGTLFIDFYDEKMEKPLWHGVLSRTVVENVNTAEKRINRNVNALFRKLTNDISS